MVFVEYSFQLPSLFQLNQDIKYKLIMHILLEMMGEYEIIRLSI